MIRGVTVIVPHLFFMLLAVMTVFRPTMLFAAEGMLAADAVLPSKDGETVALLLAIVKVAGSLFVVIGLMLLALYLVKKIGIGQGKTSDGRLIRVLESRMIAPKKYVAVVRIVDQCVALGITDQQINLLTEVEDFSMAAATIPGGMTRIDDTQPFAAVLAKAARLLGKKENKGSTGEQS